MSAAAAAFPTSRVPVVNVATVPQRSPLRYPGGKTWLIPHIREWLQHTRPEILIEPFCRRRDCFSHSRHGGSSRWLCHGGDRPRCSGVLAVGT